MTDAWLLRKGTQRPHETENADQEQCLSKLEIISPNPVFNYGHYRGQLDIWELLEFGVTLGCPLNSLLFGVDEGPSQNAERKSLL